MLKAMACVGALASFCNVAQAATITQFSGVVSYTPQVLDNVPSVTFAGFDSSLGKLQSASVSIFGSITPGVSIYSTPFMSFVTLNPGLTFYINGTGVLSGGSTQQVPLTPEESSPTLAIGKTGAAEMFNTVIALSLTYPAMGDPIDVETKASTSATNLLAGVSVYDTEDDTNITLDLTLTYTYTAVPEPSVLALLVMPLLVLARAKRRAV